MFKKIESKDETIYENFYSSWKAETIINENDIDDVFKSIHTTIITNIQKSLGKGSGLIIDSVIGHTISIWKNDPLAGNSYIKLPVELDHPRKGLINIQNVDDNECFKWCSVKYLNSADHNPRRITKHDKEFAKRLDFKDIKLPVKIRDIPKPKKKNPSVLVFLMMKIKKNNLCIKKCWEEKHVDSLLIAEGEIRSCMIIRYIFVVIISCFH